MRISANVLDRMPYSSMQCVCLGLFQHIDMNRKLKIGYDAKRLFHNHTGLGNYSRTLLRNVQSMYPQHEYHLFTPRLSDHPEVAYFLDDSKFVVHSYNGNLGAYWRSYGIKSDIGLADLDIYHGLSHELPLGKLGVRTVVSFHDLIYEYYPKQFGLWDRWSYKKKYKYAAEHADHILAISQSTKNDLIKLYQIPETKIDVVYQSCNPAFVQSTPIITDKQAYLLYVGSLIERKCAHLIVEAYRLIPEDRRIKVIIVGKGGAYADAMKRNVETYGLTDYFEFKNHINNTDLISLYDHAKALVYPSEYEGFGIPLIEALYRKTPVITTEASSLPEAAGPGALYVPPHNAEALSKAILQILDGHEDTMDLANRGYDYVHDMFSIERTASDLMNLYHKIL